MFQFLSRRKEKKRLEKERQEREMEDESDDQPERPLFAMVCVNNVNRSAAAHRSLRAAGLRACSYGAGRQVCFPGKTRTSSRVFKFLTPYAAMHRVLQREDAELFTRNGVLQILERDLPLKKAPERWQSLSNKQLDAIDVVICLDYAMFIAVLEDIQKRIRLKFAHRRLHIICLDTDDTPEEASRGSERALQLCQELDKLPAVELTEEHVKTVVQEFEKKFDQQLYYLGLHM